ncbi:hypothetical protein BYT27DRAFT_7145355 [Phlegmacium glaucopus]|nr:hypothetical protein BYT27DRAFT_7145355 [Phlegmacium glaucopus]
MKDCLSSAQPPLKRRRLARTRPSLTPQSTSAKVLANANKLTTIAIPICSTCHRALNVTHNDNIQYCARCLSITCAVCSRTCTASAASQPPTPHLTWSPTPSPSPAGGSPRRSVLSLNSPNTNIILHPPLMPTSNPTAGKRRKLVDQDDLACSRDGGQDREEFGPGCGRLLCRSCCFENIQNNTTTCLDCYGSS